MDERSVVERVLLRGGTLVDPASLAAVPGELLLVGGRIAPAGPADGALELDLRGTWVVPAPIDAHVHLDGERPSPGDPDLALLRAAHDLHALLDIGCTTVRDLGSANGVALRQAAHDGLLDAPRVIAAGQAIGPSTTEGARQAVRLALRAGADVVSVLADGPCGREKRGAARRGTPSWLRIVAEEARRQQRPLAVHTSGAAARSVVALGARTIEGGADDAALLAAMAEHDVALIPMLSAYEGRGQRRLDRQLSLVAAARRAGVRIALGTGARGADLSARQAREAALMFAAGLDADEILRSATLHAAHAVGMPGQLGELRIGSWADLVVMTVDPRAEPLSLWRSDRRRYLIRGVAGRSILRASSQPSPA